jgi:hypothetical protein
MLVPGVQEPEAVELRIPELVHAVAATVQFVLAVRFAVAPALFALRLKRSVEQKHNCHDQPHQEARPDRSRHGAFV